MKHHPQKITITPQEIDALKKFTLALSHVSLLPSYGDEKKLPPLTHSTSWNAVNMSKALEGVSGKPEGLVYSHSERLGDGAKFHQLHHLVSPQSPFAVLEFLNGERLFLEYQCPQMRLARRPEDFSFCVHIETTHSENGSNNFIAIAVWPFGDKDLSKAHLEFTNQWFQKLAEQINIDYGGIMYYHRANSTEIGNQILQIIDQLEHNGLIYSQVMEDLVLHSMGYGAEKGGGMFREKDVLHQAIKAKPLHSNQIVPHKI